MPHELVLPSYILAVSLVAFAIMLCDLGRDRKGKDPLPWPLWTVVSAAGGAFGTLAAFLVTRTHIAKATVARFFCGRELNFEKQSCCTKSCSGHRRNWGQDGFRIHPAPAFL